MLTPNGAPGRLFSVTLRGGPHRWAEPPSRRSGDAVTVIFEGE